MDSQQVFFQIIEDLKRGNRPLLKLKPEEFQSLRDELQSYFTQGNFEDINKILCILEHTQNFTDLFDKFFCALLTSPVASDDLKIHCLHAASVHIISRCERNGDPIPDLLTTSLKVLLKSQSPELLEWTLRIIEQYGNKSILFREEIKSYKPGISALFNKHKRNTLMIIEMLEKRWLAMS